MNRHYKNIALGSMAFIIAALCPTLISGSTYAVTSEPKTSAFCERLATNSTKLTANLGGAKDKLTSATNERKTKQADNRAKWDQDIATNRAKYDGQRKENFDKLMAKATTDQQKAAVTDYQTAITNAVSTRRAANDAARATFKTAVDNLVASQKSTLETQSAALTTAINVAVATAKTACAATPANGEAIKATLQASIKTAKESFSASRKSDAGIGDQIKQLTETRNSTIKANDTAFATATKAARDTLKAAFAGDGTI